MIGAMGNRRRRFNVPERIAMFLATDGRCVRCGAKLHPGWHADHRKPYSKNGATDVINGDALCPGCNMKKGDRVMPELRKWQRLALEQFLVETSDFLVEATPGAGKTTLALTAVQAFLRRGGKRVVIVVPTAHLCKQWAKAAKKFDIRLDSRFENGNCVLAEDMHGAVVTYHAVASSPHVYRRMCDVGAIVILDEVHHAGEKLLWGTALRTAFDQASRRVMLSGTPFRSDRTTIPFVRYSDPPERQCKANYRYGYVDALREHVVRPIEFAALNGFASWRDATEINETMLVDAKEDDLADAMRAALLADGGWIPSVLEEANSVLTRHREDVPDAGGLVVASDQIAANAYAEILRKITRDTVLVATSDDPLASKVIENFACSSGRWLVAVQMVSEGVDIPRLAVGVYATRIRTELFFRQFVGRFVRMRRDDDATCATMLLPAIQPLIRFAAAIEKEVIRFIKEDDDRGTGGGGGGGGEYSQPLASGEAEHIGTIFGGRFNNKTDLVEAQAIHSELGFPPNVPFAQISAAIAKIRGSGAGAAVAEGEREIRIPSEVKADLKRAVAKKKGAYHYLSKKPFDVIGSELNAECGDSSKVATEESLLRRLVVLDRWIEIEKAKL
jgi:superfamily II DNA or RNA helicase